MLLMVEDVPSCFLQSACFAAPSLPQTPLPWSIHRSSLSISTGAVSCCKFGPRLFHSPRSATQSCVMILAASTISINYQCQTCCLSQYLHRERLTIYLQNNHLILKHFASCLSLRIPRRSIPFMTETSHSD